MAYTPSNPPDWYNDYSQDIADLAETYAKEDYEAYKGPRIAEFTPDQQRAFGMVKDSVGMWKPYARDAEDALTSAQGGLNTMAAMTQNAGTFNRYSSDPNADKMFPAAMGYGSNTVLDADGNPLYTQEADGLRNNIAQNGAMAYDQFYDVYNPAMQGMQNAIDQIGQRNFTNTTLKGLNDNFAGTGQFGSGRHQILGADAAADAQARIAELKAGVEMTGRQNAMTNYMDWSKQQGQMGQQMGNYAINQAKLGTDLMNFGTNAQNLTMSDAAAIGNVGTQQQDMNQKNLTLAYQDFMDQQAYPWQQLGKWTNAVQGAPAPSYGSNVTMPEVQNPWLAGAAGGLGTWSAMSTAFKNS